MTRASQSLKWCPVFCKGAAAFQLFLKMTFSLSTDYCLPGDSDHRRPSKISIMPPCRPQAEAEPKSANMSGDGIAIQSKRRRLPQNGSVPSLLACLPAITSAPRRRSIRTAEPAPLPLAAWVGRPIPGFCQNHLSMHGFCQPGAFVA